MNYIHLRRHQNDVYAIFVSIQTTKDSKLADDYYKGLILRDLPMILNHNTHTRVLPLNEKFSMLDMHQVKNFYYLNMGSRFNMDEIPDEILSTAMHEILSCFSKLGGKQLSTKNYRIYEVCCSELTKIGANRVLTYYTGDISKAMEKEKERQEKDMKFPIKMNNSELDIKLASTLLNQTRPNQKRKKKITLKTRIRKKILAFGRFSIILSRLRKIRNRKKRKKDEETSEAKN